MIIVLLNLRDGNGKNGNLANNTDRSEYLGYPLVIKHGHMGNAVNGGLNGESSDETPFNLTVDDALRDVLRPVDLGSLDAALVNHQCISGFDT